MAIDNGKCVPSGTSDPIDNWWCEGHPSGVATQAGSCSASPTTSKGPVTDNAGETCAVSMTGGGCAAGSVCAPVAPTGFQLCSYSSTASTCPGGTNTANAYTGFTDSRGCGSCKCGTVDLACNVTGRQYFASSTACTGSAYDMLTGCSQCPLANTYAWQVDLSTNGNQTECSITENSTASGSVTPTGPVTLCCAP